MGVFDKINTVWGKIGLVQKALLAAIVIACVMTGGLLTKWATKPDMQLLFGNLDLEESSKITDKISEKDVPYEIRGNGRSIYVPADQVYSLRVSLAGDGRDDRLMSGSYLELREAERRKKQSEKKRPAGGDTYLPDFLE